MKCQAILLCVLALYLHQGEALACYECDSANVTVCADPFNLNALPLINCDGYDENITSCVKWVATEEGQKVVRRICGMPDVDYCMWLNNDTSLSINYCGECYEDGCNGSSGVLPSVLLMVVASFAVLVAALKQ